MIFRFGQGKLQINFLECDSGVRRSELDDTNTFLGIFLKTQDSVAFSNVEA